jgi:hypothetical protein
VWVCVSSFELRVANGSERVNRVPVKLIRAAYTPHSVRLEFSRDITMEMSRAEFERQKDNKDWAVEIPPESIRILRHAAEDV